MARVMVVDDEKDIRSLVTLILESAGYQVIEAADGAEALKLLEQEMPDLVLLDIMMPEIDGWEVCRQIKTRQRTKDLPVILLTVRSQPLDRVIGLEVVRADDYLTKPFDRTELLEKVEQALSKPKHEADGKGK